MAGSKNWCFTLNNFTQADVDRILSLESSPVVTYCIFGRETGESGTPHLQGFLSLSERKTLNSVVALVGQAHFSVARHISNSIEYCKKEGQFTEIGTPPATQGQRSDLDAFKEDVVLGNLDLKSIREIHSDVYAKYPRFCIEYIQDHLPAPPLIEHPLRPWQQALYDELLTEADPRKIKFLVDKVGNSGKSWFAHYFVQKNVRPAQVLLPGKKADMVYALDATARVLFVDAPRSKQGEFLQYDFLEEVKNGYVFSSKYESRMKTLHSCHVVVSMNEMPDLTKLSRDRYDIVRLGDFDPDDDIILNP